MRYRLLTIFFLFPLVSFAQSGPGKAQKHFIGLANEEALALKEIRVRAPNLLKTLIERVAPTSDVGKPRFVLESHEINIDHQKMPTIYSFYGSFSAEWLRVQLPVRGRFSISPEQASVFTAVNKLAPTSVDCDFYPEPALEGDENGPTEAGGGVISDGTQLCVDMDASPILNAYHGLTIESSNGVYTCFLDGEELAQSANVISKQSMVIYPSVFGAPAREFGDYTRLFATRQIPLWATNDMFLVPLGDYRRVIQFEPFVTTLISGPLTCADLVRQYVNTQDSARPSEAHNY